MRAVWWHGLPLVVCLALAGCAPGEPAALPCNSDEECALSQACVDGVCQAGERFVRRDAGAPVHDAGPSRRDGGDEGGDDGGDRPLVDGGLPAAGDGGEDAGEDGGALDDGGPPDGSPGEDDGGAPDAGPPDPPLLEGCARSSGPAGDLIACATPLSYAGAQAACEAMGSTLAEVDTLEDNAAVAALATALGSGVWIGLDDMAHEGVFTWRSGAALSLARFDDGEPNDTPPGEDCVLMYEAGWWNDTRCELEKPYVCGPANAPLVLDEPYCLAQPSACACDMVVHEGSLFALCDDVRDFTGAIAGCAAIGMEPVKVDAARALAFLTRQAELRARSFWLGFGDPDADGEHRYWDGTSAGLALYGNADAGTCALVSRDGVVVASPCGDAKDYACRADVPLSVAADCAPFGNGRYLGCATPRAVDEARAVCQRAGMDLVIIDDESENALVATRLAAHGGQWLGVGDEQREMLFRTVAGGVMTFSDFELDEPNDYGGGEDCVELNAYSARWNDEGCEQQRAFVCEPVLEVPPLPPAGPLCATQPGACPCQRRVKDGVVYALCAAEAPWANARDACDALGMQMLDPPSAEHDAFVREQLNALPLFPNVWLGLNDRAAEGEYLRQSGAAPSFTSWAEGQPNDYGGNQDCVEYSQELEHRWNDATCAEPRFIACQAALPPESGCVDTDDDGHGDGCALGPDCDDADARRNASALDICNLVDDDCSGAADDDDDGCSCVQVEDGTSPYWLCDNAVDWFAARGQCRAYGAELVVPADAAEDAFLGARLEERGITRAWIGVADLWSEGAYETVARAPVPYTDWATSQPTGAESADCVERRGDGWYDSSCTTTRPSVCELP